MNISKSLIITGVTVLTLLFGALLYRGLFWTFVDNYEFAYRFDALGGKVEPMVNPDGTPTHGYVFAWPLVERIHTIDTRPMQVCINANSRVLNCKLVQFNPDGFALFIKWHGRGDYDDLRLKDILMSYSYDPSQASYPFLTIQKELKNQNTDTSSVDIPQDTTATP